MLFYRVAAGCQIQPATAWHIQSRAPLTSTAVRATIGADEYSESARRQLNPHNAGEAGVSAFREVDAMPKYPVPVPRGYHVRLTEELDRDVATLAREDGVTRSHVFRDAITVYRAIRAAQRQDRRDTAA